MHVTKPTARTPTETWIFLAVGLVAASQSASIIRIGSAHPVAFATWRLLPAFAVLAPFAWRRREELTQLPHRSRLLLILSALALCGHWFTWIAAAQQTTVANATLLFASNPVLAAVGGRLLGDRAGRTLWVSVLLGLCGVAALTYGTVSLSLGSLTGDGLAVLSSVLFALYLLLGRRLRRELSSTVYVAALYGLASVVSLGALTLLELPLVSYDQQTWIAFGLLALFPTLLGHWSINHALAYVDAGRMAIFVLTEPLLATLVALWAWGEPITPTVIIGYAFIAAAVMISILPKQQNPER